MSRRTSAGSIVPTERWTPAQRRETEGVLSEILDRCGDPGRERVVRMSITLSIYRACRDDELTKLPSAFFQDPPVHMFGGAIEIIRESEPAVESAKPCEQPGRRMLGARYPDLWIPIDCGTCGPCQARQAIDKRPQHREEAPWPNTGT